MRGVGQFYFLKDVWAIWLDFVVNLSYQITYNNQYIK